MWSICITLLLSFFSFKISHFTPFFYKLSVLPSPTFEFEHPLPNIPFRPSTARQKAVHQTDNKSERDTLFAFLVSLDFFRFSFRNFCAFSILFVCFVHSRICDKILSGVGVKDLMTDLRIFRSFWKKLWRSFGFNEVFEWRTCYF